MKKISYFTIICLFAATFTGCLEDQLPVLPETGDSPVRINEAYSNGGRSTYGAYDWVELYNTSDQPVDISGYKIYDKPSGTVKKPIPANTIITAHGFYLIETENTDSPATDGSDFGLGSGGDMVYLEDNGGLLIDQIEFGALTPEQAWARNPDGSDNWQIQTPTPNASNNGIIAQPLITGVAHTPASPTNDDDVTVSATVTAGEGTLTSVKIQWTLDNTAQTDIAMTASGDVYSGTIPKQAINSAIAYSVVAQNSAGGEASVAGNYLVRDAAVIDYSGLVINEIDGNGKFIELYNGSAAPISLTGVTLVKNESATWWTGGAVSIAAGEYYVISQGVQAGITADETTGASGISPKQNLKFELKDPSGDNLLDAFVRTNGGSWGDGVTPAYDATTPKYSFSRCPDGGAFGLAVPSSKSANPSTPAGAIVTDGSPVNYADLVINEIDGNGKFIEIYNNGTNAISLENVVLRKNENATWWTGGAVSIAAGGYYTVAQSGGASGADEYTGASGISPKQNVKFELIDPDNMFVDAFVRTNGGNFGDGVTPDYGSGTKYSFSRCPDGTGSFGLAVPSCNAANPATSAGAIVTDGSPVNYAGLVINEIDGNGKFIELYNGSAAPISLTGVTLVKNEHPTQIWWTGGAVSIAAGGYYTISQTGENPGGQNEATGLNGISPKQNLKFELKEGGNLLDEFVRTNGGALGATVTPDYGSGTPYSFSRCPDGGAFGLAIPSCNAANPATSAGNIETD